MMDVELRRLDDEERALRRRVTAQSPSERWKELSAPTRPPSERSASSPREPLTHVRFRHAVEEVDVARAPPQRASGQPLEGGIDVESLMRGATFLLRGKGAARVRVSKDATRLRWEDGSVLVKDIITVDVKNRQMTPVLVLQTAKGRHTFDFVDDASPPTWLATLTYLAAGGWITRALL